jgi:hypothetical protein
MMELIARRIASPVDEGPLAGIDHPLGWRAETTLNDALAETIEWYRRNMQADPVEIPLSVRRAA